MAIQFVASEILQYAISYRINNKPLVVLLTDDASNWKFEIMKREDEPPVETLSAEELIEICNLIYGNVLPVNDTIEIKHENGIISINGKKNVTTAIIKGLSFHCLKNEC